jgi:hypothetical protein
MRADLRRTDIGKWRIASARCEYTRMRHRYSPHSPGRPWNPSIEAQLVRSNVGSEKGGERSACSQFRAGATLSPILSPRKRKGKGSLRFRQTSDARRRGAARPSRWREFFTSAREGGHFQWSQVANRKLKIVSVVHRVTVSRNVAALILPRSAGITQRVWTRPVSLRRSAQ